MGALGTLWRGGLRQASGIPHPLASSNLCLILLPQVAPVTQSQGPPRAPWVLPGQLVSWPSCCSRHPVASGTGGYAGTAALAGPWAQASSGASRPVSGCGHVDSRQRQLRRVCDDVHLSLKFWEETVACLPPSNLKTHVTLSRHPHWPCLEA